jgi:hypothetical protein
MNRAIVGIGLVSPAGIRSEQHVFLLRASGAPRWPSPFVGPDGKPVSVSYCPWLGAHAAYAARVDALVRAALDEALAPLGPIAEPMALALCWSERAPWSAAERDALERALATSVRARSVERFVGSAGFARALSAADLRLGEGARAALVVSGDSLVELSAVSASTRPPTPWERAAPPPGEGAAAVVVATPAFAEERGLATLATLLGAASAPSASNDDNQEIVDGVAMTAALRQLPPAGPVQVVSGQHSVDELRELEWNMAAARNAGRFEVRHAAYSLEGDVGQAGAAAGLMALAYGLAVMRHQATPRPELAKGPLVAWAVSRDGTRGACLARPGR